MPEKAGRDRELEEPPPRAHSQNTLRAGKRRSTWGYSYKFHLMRDLALRCVFWHHWQKRLPGCNQLG